MIEFVGERLSYHTVTLTRPGTGALGLRGDQHRARPRVRETRRHRPRGSLHGVNGDAYGNVLVDLEQLGYVCEIAAKSPELARKTVRRHQNRAGLVPALWRLPAPGQRHPSQEGVQRRTPS